MKTPIVVALLWCAVAISQNQNKTIDSSYLNNHYKSRMELFSTLPKEKGGIVFLGNSITEKGYWNELFPGYKIHNRGIGGDNTFGILARLDDVIEIEPNKVLMLVGINDLARGLPIDLITSNLKKIIEGLQKQIPNTELVIQSVLPINEDLLKAEYLKGKSEEILELNQNIKKLAKNKNIQFLDIFSLLENNNKELAKEYTNDGVHLKPRAYLLWSDYLQSESILKK